jgi:3-oxoacyl-[acyl-carrier-protein] synthase-1
MVLILGVDSFLNSRTLQAYIDAGRILTSVNSNGFMPGEAATAILVGDRDGSCAVAVTGLGFALESAHVASDLPLRADGLTRAVSGALQDAGRRFEEIDFRITDLSGEYYYFKEAALLTSRCLRTPKQEFDIWHPAECTGAIGAATGPLTLALASEAVKKRDSKGPRILCHSSADPGQRAAAIVEALVHES